MGLCMDMVTYLFHGMEHLMLRPHVLGGLRHMRFSLGIPHSEECLTVSDSCLAEVAVRTTNE